MAQSKFRRAPRVEGLESRELLSTVPGGPSPDAQYMLQVLNMVRTDPPAASQYIQSHLDSDIQLTLAHYGVDLNSVLNSISSSTAQPPLAWNDQLYQSAQGHSDDMAANGIQSHDGSDGSSVTQRMQQAGYNPTSESENVYSYAKSIDQAMEAFLIDWGVSDNGHRNNILQPGVSAQDANRDVGIGIADGSTNGTGPLLITQDFGSKAGEKAQLVGVVFNDNQKTGFYAPGEGQGDVTITAINRDNGQVSTVQTWDSGGYVMTLDPGPYEVVASRGGQVLGSQSVTIGNVNAEVDFSLSSSSATSGSLSDAIAAAQPRASQPVASPSPQSQSQSQSPSQPANPPVTQPSGSAIDFSWSNWIAKKANQP